MMLKIKCSIGFSKLEKIRNSKVIVFYSFDILKPSDFETIFDLLNATGKQNKIDGQMVKSYIIAYDR